VAEPEEDAAGAGEDVHPLGRDLLDLGLDPVDRLDLPSGRRQIWRPILPPDPVGVYGTPRVLLSADGESYVYAHVRFLDELYLVDGLR